MRRNVQIFNPVSQGNLQALSTCSIVDASAEQPFSLSRKIWSIVKRLAILGNFCGQTKEEKL